MEFKNLLSFKVQNPRSGFLPKQDHHHFFPSLSFGQLNLKVCSRKYLFSCFFLDWSLKYHRIQFMQYQSMWSPLIRTEVSYIPKSNYCDAHVCHLHLSAVSCLPSYCILIGLGRVWFGVGRWPCRHPGGGGRSTAQHWSRDIYLLWTIVCFFSVPIFEGISPLHDLSASQLLELICVLQGRFKFFPPIFL